MQHSFMRHSCDCIIRIPVVVYYYMILIPPWCPPGKTPTHHSFDCAPFIYAPFIHVIVLFVSPLGILPEDTHADEMCHFITNYDDSHSSRTAGQCYVLHIRPLLLCMRPLLICTIPQGLHKLITNSIITNSIIIARLLPHAFDTNIGLF